MKPENEKTSKTRKPRAASGPKGKLKPLGPGASLEARKRAAAVLQVLAGGMTPSQAASSLSLTLPRYYFLEEDALQGLVKGCEPKAKGRVKSEKSRTEQLEREHGRLKQECARWQALARSLKRAVGLKEQVEAAKPQPPGKRKRRKSKPKARALSAAARLQSSVARGENKELSDGSQAGPTDAKGEAGGQVAGG